MQRLILLVLTAVLAVALGAGQYYVPRSYYVIDDEGHQSAPVALRRLRRSASYPSYYFGGLSNANANAKAVAEAIARGTDAKADAKAVATADGNAYANPFGPAVVPYPYTPEWGKIQGGNGGGTGPGSGNIGSGGVSGGVNGINWYPGEPPNGVGSSAGGGRGRGLGSSGGRGIWAAVVPIEAENPGSAPKDGIYVSRRHGKFGGAHSVSAGSSVSVNGLGMGLVDQYAAVGC